MPPVSEIKLIRTDTTLDLSQKAEKVYVAREDAYLLILVLKIYGLGLLKVSEPGLAGSSESDRNADDTQHITHN
jgi:hypothetical protein